MRSSHGIFGAGLVTALLIAARPVNAQSTGPVSANLPSGVNLSSVVLSTSGALTIENGAQVGSSVNDTLVGAGPAQCAVGENARIGTLYCAGQVRFGASTADGRVVSASIVQLSPQARVVGVSQSADLKLEPTLLTSVSWGPPAGAAIDLQPGTDRALAPGSYLSVAVKARAQLRLSAGTYVFESFTTEPDSSLLIDDSAGPVLIQVRGNVIHRATMQVRSGGANTLLVSLGNQLTLESTFIGSAIAMQADMTLGGRPGGPYQGTFFARSILVRPNVRIVRVPSRVLETPLTPKVIDPARWTPIPGYQPNTCGPTLTADRNSEGITRLRYAPATPGCQPRFCDASGNPVPAPTEAELNRAPARSEQCAAIASREVVDATRLHGTCNADADCPSGERCTQACSGAGCVTTDKACGPLVASSAGIPAEREFCDAREFRECPDPRNNASATPAQVRAAWPEQVGPQPTGQVSPAERMPVEPYLTLAQFNQCTAASAPAPKEPEQSSDKLLRIGTDNWGAAIEPFFKQHVKIGRVMERRRNKSEPRAPGEAEEALGGWLAAEAGLNGNVIVFGRSLNVVSVRGAASIGCKTEVGVDLRLLGDTVASADSVNGFQGSFGSLEGVGDQLRTKPEEAAKCNQWFNERNAVKGDLRGGSVAARAVYNFVSDNGANADLCRRTEAEFGGPDNDPSVWPGCDPDDPDLSHNVDIPNAWRKEYEKSKRKFLDFKQTKDGPFKDGHHFGGNLALLNLGKRYSFAAADANIPVGLGPLTLTLAIELYGTWHVTGGIDVGLNWKGSVMDAFRLASTGGSSTVNGDFMGGVGPVIEPGADVNVSAYVGLGIPGVSVGVEGNVLIFGIALPAKIQATAMRVAEPDTRDIQQSAFAGAEDPDFPHDKVYRWKAGLSYSVDARLAALKGQLNAAARVKVLFYRKTFKTQIAQFAGFQEAFRLAGGPILGELDLGNESEAVGNTKLEPFTTADLPANPNPNAHLFTPIGSERCGIIID